jgi:hypothetical protein
MSCQCGCGEEAASGSFKPGHDQKLRIALESRAGGIEGLRRLVEAAESAKTSELTDAQKCDKEIDDLFKRIDSDQSEYDKQLLTLSSGFLAVSLAFIKDVVPLEIAKLLPLLYWSCGLLAACVCLVLFSFQFSIAGQLKAKEYWERRKSNPDEPFSYRRATIAKFINWGGGVLFGVGVVLSVSFVIYNLQLGAIMSGKSIRTGDGAYIKTPANGEERGSLIKAPAKPAPAQPSSSGGNRKDINQN